MNDSDMRRQYTWHLRTWYKIVYDGKLCVLYKNKRNQKMIILFIHARNKHSDVEI
jgi:hypothetical protein